MSMLATRQCNDGFLVSDDRERPLLNCTLGDVWDCAPERMWEVKVRKEALLCEGCAQVVHGKSG